MRDNHYRKSCTFEADYDRVIDLIQVVNPHCAMKSSKEDREEFASGCVNSCISGVLYAAPSPDIKNALLLQEHFCCTGGAMATRASTNEASPEYRKVILSVRI